MLLSRLQEGRTRKAVDRLKCVVIFFSLSHTLTVPWPQLLQLKPLRWLLSRAAPVTSVAMSVTTLVCASTDSYRRRTPPCRGRVPDVDRASLPEVCSSAERLCYNCELAGPGAPRSVCILSTDIWPRQATR